MRGHFSGLKLRWLNSSLGAIDGNTDAIPDLGNRLNDVLRSEALAQFGNCGGQRRVDDDEARPDGIKQFLFADDLASAQEQLQQNVERLAFKLDSLAADGELISELIEFALSESPPDARPGFR